MARTVEEWKLSAGRTIEVRVGEEVFRFGPADVVHLGRDDDNDVVCDNRNVSRHHAELRHEGGVWLLVDMNSTQGIFVDGEPVQRYVVRPNADVVLGLPDRGQLVALTVEGHTADTATFVPSDATRRNLKQLGGGWAPPVEPSTPSIRAVVFTDICGSVAQTVALGDAGHIGILDEHNQIVRSALATFSGREVKHTGDGIMAAFGSIASAISFAVAVQVAIARRNRDAENELQIRVGVSAGEPHVDERDDLFGATVQLAARLCTAAPAGEIFVSAAVRELCIGKAFEFEDQGRIAVKGMPEPMQTYRVMFSDGAP